MRILFAGIIGRYPFGGVTWCSLMYLLGLRDLGHEVCYLEDTGECIYDADADAISEDPAYGTRYIHEALAPHGLGDRWCFVNYDETYHGWSRDRLREYCRGADLYIDLSGGCWFWRDEYRAIPRRIFIDSDPVFTQLAIAKGVDWYVDFFRGFDHLFTFGANIGTPACEVPTSGFTWHPTWQPIVTRLWRTERPPARERFTTVMTWKTESFTDVDGNKDREFVRFIDLPARTAARFELAVNGPHELLRACTGGRRSTRCACRARRTPIAISSRGRRPSSAWPSTPTSRTGRDGSATGPPAISPRDVPRSCRTPGGAPICHRAPG